MVSFEKIPIGTIEIRGGNLSRSAFSFCWLIYSQAALVMHRVQFHILDSNVKSTYLKFKSEWCMNGYIFIVNAILKTEI